MAVLVAVVSTVASMGSLWESSSDSDHVFPSAASTVEMWGQVGWARRWTWIVRKSERVKAVKCQIASAFDGNANLKVLIPICGDFFSFAMCDRRCVCVGLELSLGRPGCRNQLAVLVERTGSSAAGATGSFSSPGTSRLHGS